MVPMKRGPIGVWFSVALTILVLSVWAGAVLGAAVARYWYGHHQQEQGTLSGPELTRVESELDELSEIQTLRLYIIFALEKKEPGDKNLLNEINRLRDLKRRSKAPGLEPLVDLDLGLSYVQAAMAEEQDNNDNEGKAKKYMQSAQALFDSLGWQDHSEETLKAVANRELDKWRRPRTQRSEK